MSCPDCNCYADDGWYDDEDDDVIAPSREIQLSLPFDPTNEVLKSLYTPALQAMLNNSALLLRRLCGPAMASPQGMLFTIPVHRAR
jgi:hypothetical protein